MALVAALAAWTNFLIIRPRLAVICTLREHKFSKFVPNIIIYDDAEANKAN